ncbi:hypothetical protein ACN47E_002800 [Coniothyrium glycines]
MHTRLLVVVILLSVLGPVVAASPIMDNALPGDEYNTDFEGLLWAVPVYQYLNAGPRAAYAAYRAPHTAARTPLEQLQLPRMLGAEQIEVETDLGPVIQYLAGNQQQPQQQPPLVVRNVRAINENGTTVQHATVQAHVEDTYTPGDRTVRPRRSPQRRQAPRPNGGFVCDADGCGKSFIRACELNRHSKTHLDPSERPHKCLVCEEGFLYPKDRQRHERKHIEEPADQTTFFCRYPRCSNHSGFTRRDNLLRHQRTKHRIDAVA